MDRTGNAACAIRRNSKPSETLDYFAVQNGPHAFQFAVLEAPFHGVRRRANPTERKLAVLRTFWK
eukprot:2234082-Alexandrium_andersonii.AAC.1